MGTFPTDSPAIAPYAYFLFNAVAFVAVAIVVVAIASTVHWFLTHIYKIYFIEFFLLTTKESHTMHIN